MQNAQVSLFVEMPDRLSAAVSKKAFAGMVGVSQGRVSQFIKAGLPVEPSGLIHIERGKAWIESNTDPYRRRASVGERSDAGDGKMTPRGVRDVAEARIATAKANKIEGSLISRAATLRVVEARAKMESDALVGWVNRVAPLVAAAVGADISTIASILDREVREHLAMMAAKPLDLK